MKKSIIAISALGAAICATAVWSQMRPGPPPGGPAGPMVSCPAMATMPPRVATLDAITQPLKLSKTQVAKLKAIATKDEKNHRTLTQRSADASKSLRSAVLTSKYDAKKVKDLAVRAGYAESALVNANIAEWVQIRAILKADQIAKLQTAMSPRPGMHPGGPPPGGFGPPPPSK